MLRALVLVVAILGVSWSWSVSAIQLDFGDYGIEGSLDTTLSLGLGIRVSDRDEKHIARVSGGVANSANTDDGNLNYDQWDIFSLNKRITQELDLRRENIGLFMRSTYLYDWAVMDLSTRRTELSREAEDRSGIDLRLLDAYFIGDFRLFDRPLTLRLGSMVINWGESTFIQNGINTINPVDVSKLRVAGAELREAFVPVPSFHASFVINPKFSLEGFYQFAWQPTEIEPVGTYFSTSDIAGPGADRVMLGFGGATDIEPTVRTFVQRRRRDASDPNSAFQDESPSGHGQFGFAFRYFEPALNDTEFGFYYTNLHSRLPIISAQTGLVLSDAEAIALGADPGAPAAAPNSIASIRTGALVNSSRYFRDYPKHIHSFGFSFNTQVNWLDMALQGEFVYRKRQPLQVDDVELLFGALSASIPSLAISQAVDSAAGPNEEISGVRRKDMIQAQVTGTKLFGPIFGMSDFVILGELGMTQILGMESQEDLRYEAPGTYTSGNPAFTGAGVQPATQDRGFPSRFSMGYRLLTSGRFDNAIGAVSLIPSLAFSHDFKGTTPAPLLNFIQGRMTLTTALAATYLNKYRAELSYTNYFGASHFNLLNDRDFVSLTASVSF